jgi:hypothetical protein
MENITKQVIERLAMLMAVGEEHAAGFSGGWSLLVKWTRDWRATKTRLRLGQKGNLSSPRVVDAPFRGENQPFNPRLRHLDSMR